MPCRRAIDPWASRSTRHRKISSTWAGSPLLQDFVTLGNAQDQIWRPARAPPRSGSAIRCFDDDAVLFQHVDQIGRVFSANHRHGQWFLRLLQHARNHAVDQQHEDDQRHQPGQQGVEHGAAVTQVFAHFLKQSGGVHAASPSTQFQ